LPAGSADNIVFSPFLWEPPGKEKMMSCIG
jgi:hypothetical protein